MSYIEIAETFEFAESTKRGRLGAASISKKTNGSWCFAYDDLNCSRYLSVDLSNVSHPEEDHQKLGNTLRLEDYPSSQENETPLEKFLLTKHAKRLSIKIHNR